MPESIERVAPESLGDFEVGRTTRSWRRLAGKRIITLRNLAKEINEESAKGKNRREISQAMDHLDQATREVEGSDEWMWSRALTGRSQEHVVALTDAAEINLLHAASDDRFESLVPEITFRVRKNLSPIEPLRESFNEMLNERRIRKVPIDREIAITALRGANDSRLRRYASVRTFNRLLQTMLLLLTLTICAITLVGVLHPSILDFCFESEGRIACPISSVPRAGDIGVVEIAGVAGAMALVPASLRRFQGTVQISMLPFTCTVLKIPMGALCAILGLMLMEADFIPGFGGLNQRSEIIAWAAIFGCCQEFVTGNLDRQAQRITEKAVEPFVLFQEADQWSDIMDQRLREAEANLSESVGGVVERKIAQSFRGAEFFGLAGLIATTIGASVKQSLQGPENIAFKGYIEVAVHKVEGNRLEADPCGITLNPGTNYTLRVRLSTDEPENSVSRWELMSVAGKAGQHARFAVIPEIDGLIASPSRQEVPIQTEQGAAVCDFELHTPSRTGNYPAWVAIYQHTKLVHVVRFHLIVSAEE
ncbi:MULTISPECIES: hypothetical protein [unclassified Streptomyces]|uniref:hypothetical protein n=1 Tax=unclassified Streptomyces TaxID=2593676 RepID=UPI003814F6A6